MSLPGIRPRGKKGEAPDKGAIHSPGRIKTNTHTPRRRVAGKGGENGQRAWPAVKTTGAHTPRPSTLPRMRKDFSREQECQ